MRHLAILWCVICLTASVTNGAQVGTTRAKYNFNSDWKVSVGDPADAKDAAFDDSSWKTVTTPYAWNEDDAFRKDIKDLSTGIAWYRKHFKLPSNSSGRKIFLEFEGIRHGGEFYLNGKLIGRHENGVMAFGFDITDFVKPVPQENVLAGKTPLSLGYVTLSFAPHTGSNLKIELTADDTDDKGAIGIFETEIYDASQTSSQQSTINPKLPTIFVVGDSTANNNANGGRGWGDPFISLFDTTKVNVLNRARAGRSSRTFITQGLWDNVLNEMKRGDLVLIQFGHNDGGAINDASRARGSLPGTGEETEEIDNLLTKQHEVVHTYGWYLRKMIADTKAKGAIPIVLSLTVRNIWKDGHVERGSGKFGQWAAEVAASQQVVFVDVTELIADRYEQLGEAKVKELFATDHTHTNAVGAQLNASLILNGLQMLENKPFNRFVNHR